MKKALMILSSLLVAVGAFAQGQVNFSATKSLAIITRRFFWATAVTTGQGLTGQLIWPNYTPVLLRRPWRQSVLHCRFDPGSLLAIGSLRQKLSTPLIRYQ